MKHFNLVASVLFEVLKQEPQAGGFGPIHSHGEWTFTYYLFAVPLQGRSGLWGAPDLEETCLIHI